MSPCARMYAGHVLVDLLEEVYSSMMKHYKRIRRDALILIDVAGDSERGVLNEKLLLNLYGNEDSLVRLLRLFTKLPIISVSAFYKGIQDIGKVDSRRTRIVFEDLHINNDISKSSFYNGHMNHPCIFSHRDLNRQGSKIAELSVEYHSFRSYILTNLGFDDQKGGKQSKQGLIHMTLIILMLRFLVDQ